MRASRYRDLPGLLLWVRIVSSLVNRAPSMLLMPFISSTQSTCVLSLDKISYNSLIICPLRTFPFKLSFLFNQAIYWVRITLNGHLIIKLITRFSWTSRQYRFNCPSKKNLDIVKLILNYKRILETCSQPSNSICEKSAIAKIVDKIDVEQ